jgi:uncharacterized protein
MLEPISIPRLTRMPQRTDTVPFNQKVADFETLTPVQGWLRVTHHGNYLEIEAQADAIVTLTCDRCLQQYNHRLTIAPQELIWLSDEADSIPELVLDQDLDPEELVESLPTQGQFDAESWVYEQLSLELPQQALCDVNCHGISFVDSNPSEPQVDQRWASLENLRNQLNN